MSSENQKPEKTEKTAGFERRERLDWVDVVKGLGILAVVIGHYRNPATRYLYWFHMPLFFALSGYLFRPVLDMHILKKWIRKRTNRLLVPYAAFVLLLFLAEYIRRPITDPSRLGTDIASIILGGRMISPDFVSIYAAFWFVTCLYVTQVLFALVAFRWRSMRILAGLVVAAYLLAHIEAFINLHHRIRIPWNMDVALIAMSYYAFGFFAKSFLSEINRWWKITTAAIILTAAFLAADILGFVHYKLDLKYVGYTHLLLDILVPVAFIVVVCAISQMLSRTKAAPILAVLGMASLPIMYLHMYINHFIRSYFDPGLILFTLIGILFPLAVWWLVLNRFAITRRIFLGSSEGKSVRS